MIISTDRIFNRTAKPSLASPDLLEKVADEVALVALLAAVSVAATEVASTEAAWEAVGEEVVSSTSRMSVFDLSSLFLSN
jgi:hypothetical protein